MSICREIETHVHYLDFLGKNACRLHALLMDAVAHNVMRLLIPSNTRPMNSSKQNELLLSDPINS